MFNTLPYLEEFVEPYTILTDLLSNKSELNNWKGDPRVENKLTVIINDQKTLNV